MTQVECGEQAFVLYLVKGARPSSLTCISGTEVDFVIGEFAAVYCVQHLLRWNVDDTEFWWIFTRFYL